MSGEAKRVIIYTLFHMHSKNLDFFLLYTGEANLTFCCGMFDSQFCPLSVKKKYLAVKYKNFSISLVKI